MALAYAILASLLDCPSSGYELNKTFESSVGCFWKASHQQIYRELGKLEEQAWVDVELIAQRDRPDKKLYRVTAAGKQALMAWIAQPNSITPIKEELLVKVFVGNLVPPAQICQAIADHRQHYEALLATYQQVEANYFARLEVWSVADTFRHLTLRRGIRYATDWIGWCDEALERIAHLPPGTEQEPDA